MSNAQILTENIKNIAKSKNITLKSMLSDCDLNVNTLNQISDKKGISCFGLERIADYLSVSVDYLLGRTEEPEKIRNTQNNTNGNNNISINKTESAISEIGQEMLKILESLPTRERINLLKMAYDYQEEYTKK